MDARRPFRWVYNELLASAVEVYTDLLTQAILSSHGRHKPIHWLEIAASAVRFVEKFTDDDYVENLLGLFLEHQRQMQDPIGMETRGSHARRSRNTCEKSR